MPHKPGVMELQQTADAKYVYIVNKEKGKMDIRAWDIQTLTSLKEELRISRRHDNDDAEKVRIERFNKSVRRIKSASDFLK
jgi:hypothetical protein